MADQRKLKKIAQRSHFRRRAYERLGYELRAAEIRDIKRQITEKRGRLITRPNSRLTLWRVVVNGRTMVVVHDCDTDELATIMTEAVWQAQDMQNSPHVVDETELRGSLADTPAGQALAALKGED
jgi:hypothetical protein